MGSLTEIEAAVERLSQSEQEELLRHLQQKLLRPVDASNPLGREEWLKRLDELRASTSVPGRANQLSTDQILDESREERI